MTSSNEAKQEVPEGIGDVAAQVTVSSASGRGLDTLRQILPGLVYQGLVHAAPDAPVLTRRRHANALGAALVEVRAFAEGVRAGMPAEVVATHLRPAETALEELLGVISVDDVLDVVFREFCVGK
jgi:tRNA modification GTPase